MGFIKSFQNLFIILFFEEFSKLKWELKHQIAPNFSIIKKEILFEKFKIIGGSYNGEKIDTSGVLYTGESFKGIKDIQNIITRQKLDLYVESLVRKMMVYALGRGLEFYDERVVEHIVKRLSAKGYQHHELVVSIVQSLPFDMKRGESSN